MSKIRIQIVDHDRNEIDHDFSNAKNVVEFLLPIAMSIVETEGEAEPMLCVVSTDKIYFVRVAEFFCDDLGKEAFRDFVVDICSKPEVEGIGLVTEAWTVMRDDLENIEGQISDAPDRKEVLMVYSEWHDGTIVDVMIPILTKENGTKKMGKPNFLNSDESSGRMRGFFVPGKITLH